MRKGRRELVKEVQFRSTEGFLHLRGLKIQVNLSKDRQKVVLRLKNCHNYPRESLKAVIRSVWIKIATSELSGRRQLQLQLRGLKERSQERDLKPNQRLHSEE